MTLNETIHALIDFTHYLQDAPRFHDLDFATQNKLLAAYVGEMDVSDLTAATHAFNTHMVTTILLSGIIDNHTGQTPLVEIEWPWADLISGLRASVIGYAENDLDTALRRRYEEFCFYYGNYAHTPEGRELVGFKNADV